MPSFQSVTIIFRGRYSRSFREVIRNYFINDFYADPEQRINGAATSERVKLNKQLSGLQAQAEEIRMYEEKIHHLADQMICIDLDDGGKHNYEIFKVVLAKIK